MIYEELISPENLFRAWDQFKKGKLSKMDVLQFERHLEDNVFFLSNELLEQAYRHRPYQTFRICDPKPRLISKAGVRDRLIHHVIFDYLDNVFNATFIYHSYSSRLNKGTHLAIQNLNHSLRALSVNYTRPVYALKCDIKRFFHSINHQKLLNIIKSRVKDAQILWLLDEVISSFPGSVGGGGR
jgi:retron-type reverse transcriptase